MEHPRHEGYVQSSGFPHLWVRDGRVIYDTSVVDKEANSTKPAAQSILAEFEKLDKSDPISYEDACVQTTGERYRATGSNTRDRVAAQGHHPICRYKKGNEIGWVISK